MKLCWDNIENIRLSKYGNFRNIIKGKVYKIRNCKECGKEALMRNSTKFCCLSCANRYISRNRKITKEMRNKISKTLKSKNIYSRKGIPTYDIYASQLNWCEEVRRSPKDRNVLEVKCTYCGRWYIPSLCNVINRKDYLKYDRKTESRFYCSEQCKQSCPLYGKSPQTLMKEDAIRAGRLGWLELNREVQPELRQMVLKRDNYTCQKCGTTDKPLHCHHILPVAKDPLESADIDNCITYCEYCHKEAHKQDGCRTGQLKMEVC